MMMPADMAPPVSAATAMLRQLEEDDDDVVPPPTPPPMSGSTTPRLDANEERTRGKKSLLGRQQQAVVIAAAAAFAQSNNSSATAATSAAADQQQLSPPEGSDSPLPQGSVSASLRVANPPSVSASGINSGRSGQSLTSPFSMTPQTFGAVPALPSSARTPTGSRAHTPRGSIHNGGGATPHELSMTGCAPVLDAHSANVSPARVAGDSNSELIGGQLEEGAVDLAGSGRPAMLGSALNSGSMAGSAPSSARLSVRTGASARVSPKNVTSNDASVSSARRTSAVVNGRLAVPGAAAVAPIPSPLGGSTATPNAASAFTSSPAVAAAPPAREVPIGSNGKPKLTKAEKEAKRARKAEIRAERDRRKSEHPHGEGDASTRSQTAAADRTSLSSAPTLTSPVDSAVAVGSKRGSPMDDDHADAEVPMAADNAGDQEGLRAEESQPAALANVDGAVGPEERNAGGDTAVELLDANTTSVGDYGPRSARAALAAEKAELMADSALLYHTRQQTAAEAEASTRHRIEVQSLAAPGGSGSYASHQQGGLAAPGQGQGHGGTSNGGGATLYKASPHSPTPFDATTPQKEGGPAGPAELSGPTEQSPSSLFTESRNGMVGLLTPDRGDGRPAQGVVRRSHVSQHSRLPSHTGDGPEDVDAAFVRDGDGEAPVEVVRRPLPGGIDDSGFMSHSDDGLSFPLLAMAKDAIAEEERRTKELLAPRAAASPTPSDGNISGAGRQSKPASANRTPYALEPVKKFKDFCVDEIDLDATVPRLKPKDPDDSPEKERKESKANSVKSKTDITASLRSSTDDKASVVSGQAAANTGGVASSVCSGDRVVASRPGSGAVSASVTPRDPQLEQKKRQHANTAAAMGMAPKAQRTSRGGPEFKFNKQARGVGGGGLFHRDKERLATQRQLQGHGARSSTPDVTSQVRANLAMGDDLLGDTLRSESGMARPGTSGGRSSSVGAGGISGGGGTAHFRRATDFNRAAHLNPAILAMPTVDESKMRIAPLPNRTKHLGQVYDFQMEAATQQVCDHATFRVLLEKEEEIAKAKGKSVSWQVQPKSSAADKRDGSVGRDDSVPRPKSQGQMLDEVGLDPHLKAARSSARLVLSAMFKPPTEPRLRIGGGPRTPEKTSATTAAKKTASSQRPSSASRHRPPAAVAAATADHNDDDLQAFDDEAAAVGDHGAPIAAAEQLPGDTSGGLPGALSASHFAQSDVSLTQQFLAVPSGKPKGKKPSRGSSPARGGAKSPGAGSRSPSARNRSPSPTPTDQMPGGKPLATRSPSNASVLSAASAASGAAGAGGTESRQGHRGSRACDKAAALYAAIHGAAGDVAVPAEIRRETELDELRRLITTPAVTKISASAISNAELSASLAVARKVPTPTPQQIAGSAGAGIETQQDREVEDAFRRSLLHRSTGDDAWKHNKVFEAGKSYAKALQLELVLNSRGDDFVDINVRLGDVFVALDSPDDAVPLYLKAADVSTVSLKATGRLKKARVLAHAGRVMLEAGFPHLAQPFLSDAVAVMERDMPQSVEHAEALRMLVQSAMTIAAPDDETATTSAIVALQEALAILDVVSPQSLEAARVLRDLAELTLTRRNDPDDALELAAKAQQIVERASKNGTYDTARILEVQGDCNMERCQPHIALGQYERACRLMDAAFPSHPDFILLTAKAMTASAESKKIGSAKAYFKNALTVDGKYKHLYYARGLSLMSKGEVENAYGAFYNAIECDPSYFDAIVGRLELVRTMMNDGHDAVAKCDFPTEVSRARELLEMSKYDSWKITELRKQSRVCRFPGTVRMPPNRCRSVDDYHAALQELLDAFETETKTLITERAIRRKTAKKEPVVRSRKQSLVNPVTANEDHGFPLTRYLRPSDFNPDCMLDNPTVLLEDMDRAVARPMCDVLKEAGIDIEAGLNDDDQRSQRSGRAGGEDQSQSQSEGGHGQTLSVPGGGALGGALGGGGSRAGSRRASAAGHRGAINAFADGSRLATPTNRRRSTAGMLSGLGGEGEPSAAPGVQNVGSISLMLPADLPASAAAADAAALDQRGSEGGAQHRSDATADDAQVPAIDAGFVAFGEDDDGAPFSPNPEHPGDGGIRRGSTSMTGPGASGVGSALNSARAATVRRRSSLLPTVGPPRGGGGTPASASTTSVIIGTERRRSTAVFADVTDDIAVDARRTSVMIGPDGLPSAFANTDGAASRQRSRDPTGRRSSTQVVVQRKEDGSVALSEQDKVMNLTVDGIKNLREPPPFTVKGAELQPLREAGLRFLEPDTPAASKLFFTALVSELRAVFFAHLVLVAESAAAAPGAAGLGSHAITTTAADTMDPSGKMYRDFVKFLITGTDTCAQYTSQYLNAGLTHVVVQGAKMRTGPGAAQLRKTFANEAWRDDVCASVKITSRTALLRLRQLNLNRFNFGAVAVRLGLAIIEQLQQGQLFPADDVYTGCPFGKERHNLAQDMGQSVEVAGKSVDEARRRHLKYFFERCPTPVEAAARAHAWAFVSRVTSADNSVAVAAFEVSNRHHKANQRAAERAKKAGKKGSKSSAHSSPNFADLGEDSPGGTPAAVTPRGMGGGGADYDVRQPFSEGLPVVSVLFGEDARCARQEERTHGGAGGKSGSAAGGKVDSDALRSDGESLNQCCVIA